MIKFIKANEFMSGSFYKLLCESYAGLLKFMPDYKVNLEKIEKPLMITYLDFPVP